MTVQLTYIQRPYHVLNVIPNYYYQIIPLLKHYYWALTVSATHWDFLCFPTIILCFLCLLFVFSSSVMLCPCCLGLQSNFFSVCVPNPIRQIVPIRELSWQMTGTTDATWTIIIIVTLMWQLPIRTENGFEWEIHIIN